MSSNIVKPEGNNAKKYTGGLQPRLPETSLHEPGILWVCNLLAIYGVGRTALYDGLRAGTYPKEDGRVGRRRFWRHSTIRKFLER